MATKLKNLSVTSVDLVDRGANPDAHIRLFKRKQETDTDTDEGIIRKFLAWLKKGYEDAAGGGGNVDEPVNNVEKDATTFADNISREQMRAVTSEMYDCCYALSDSLCSIICDKDLSADAKKTLMSQSLDEFTETVRGALAHWAAGKKMESQKDGEESGIQKSAEQERTFAKLWSKYEKGFSPSEAQETSKQNEMEVMETMKIDKSRMTPEEQATLAEFEKKYGVGDGAAADDDAKEADKKTPDGGVAKGADIQHAEPDAGAAELHPDVKKALSEYQELMKRQSAEVEELKKSLEIERLTAVAKKYEVLGKKADELAVKLYDLKKAGGTVYDDYVALLDENVTALTKSGLFGEIGKNTQGSAGTEQTIGIKAAELAKSAEGGMTTPEAIIKAFEENPELAAQYEAEYSRR